MIEDASPELDHIIAEYLKCERDPCYFLRTYVKIEVKADDGEGGEWIPFDLWPAQEDVIGQLRANRLVVILKARQLGQTWMMLGYYLWKMLFRPGSAIGLWSRRLPEAIELLDRRLKGMHARLPAWLQAKSFEEDNKTVWELSNGSRAMAFTTSSGDSYTFTDALVDEADLCLDLGRMMDAVKPTIDGGGSMVLLSKSNKRAAATVFKRIFRKAEQGKGPWHHIFLPWHARPGRDEVWYEAQREHSLSQNESLDYLHENYPATSAEALSPSSAGKRLPGAGLLGVYEESDTVASLPVEAPRIHGVRIYALPVPGRDYLIGADPAEGLPGKENDDSGLCVVDKVTGEEVCAGLGRWEPGEEFPDVIEGVAVWFNNAAVLVERNNHGHAVLSGLKRRGVTVLNGSDGRPGYPKSPASKAQVWVNAWTEIRVRKAARSEAAEANDELPPPLIRDPTTFGHLASLEAKTCKAPKGEHDDAADAWGLGQEARSIEPPPEARVEVW